MTTFDSVSPATGDIVATFPVMGEDEIRTIVEDAREAGRWWAQMGYAAGKKRLLKWRTVIGPWNYPIFTPMGSIACALAAGNAVVFEPSEYTPGVGQWIVESFAQVVPEQPVLQLATGRGESGAALCTSGAAKVAFTGSTTNGKKVIAGVPEDSAAVQEETFGPVLVVNRGENMDEAIERANATPDGLAAAVFSGKRADEIVARLRCAMAAINSIISFAGVPGLPFGGVGASGFGRIHGKDVVREFTRVQSVAKLRVPIPLVLTSFARQPWAVKFAAGAVRRRFRG